MTNNEVAICIITSVIVIFGLLFAGGEFENRRIYNRCLDNVAEMPYTHAKTLCKEFTK